LQRDALLEALGETAQIDDLKLEGLLTSSTSARVRRAIETQVERLGIAIAGLINIFNPEAVLLAGFLGILLEVDRDHLEKVIAEHVLEPSWTHTQILRTEPGSDLLMIGTSELPLAPLLKDPSGFEFTRAVTLTAVEKSTS
jgi:predicted NBD/HSP70 family sugar kinase